jgi:hypothetical protein
MLRSNAMTMRTLDRAFRRIGIAADTLAAAALISWLVVTLTNVAYAGL